MLTVIKITSLHHDSPKSFFVKIHNCTIIHFKGIILVIHVLCILTYSKYSILIILQFKIKFGGNSTLLLQFRIIVYLSCMEKSDSYVFHTLNR